MELATMAPVHLASIRLCTEDMADMAGTAGTADMEVMEAMEDMGKNKI